MSERPVGSYESLDDATLRRRRSEVAPGIGGMVAAIVVAIGIYDSYAPTPAATSSDHLGPWFFPVVACGGIFAGSLRLVFRRGHGYEMRQHAGGMRSFRERELWLSLVAIPVAVWAMNYLGLYVTIALILAWLAFVCKLPIRSVAAVAVVMELVALLLFATALGVPLPGWNI